ncbi:Capsular polysaccharide phosphotransferase cps12A [Providencia manganoxydans]|uniref:glycosyl transferase n=2 Tax=Providencia TaxID=586 RepID=UPI003DA032FC
MKKIDFVIPWVDHTDLKWQKDFNKYYSDKTGQDANFERYRDWGLLKYWFRGVEHCTPWVNKIHFITYGHVPEWLNINHPKINIVRHSDYIPAEFLPTFSANPIEIFIHKIDGISKYFVYFNDDMYLLKKTSPNYFFKENLPCDISILNALSPSGISHIILNDLNALSKKFNKRSVMKNNISKWFSIKYKEKLMRNILLLPWPSFTGFFDHHLPQPFLKETFEEVWNENSDILLSTAQSKFRSISDVNQYLFRYWQLCKGNFHPKNFSDSKYFTLTDGNVSQITDYIYKRKKHIITINDSNIKKFPQISNKLNTSFNFIYPNKSTFEK